MQISKIVTVCALGGCYLCGNAALGAGDCVMQTCSDACTNACGGGTNGSCLEIVRDGSRIFSMCSCTSCSGGYTKSMGNSLPSWASAAGALSGCNTMTNNIGTLATTVYKCTSPCTDCEVETTFTVMGTSGYRRRVKSATCNTSTGVCTRTYEYRCATDWFGSSTNGVTGCRKCPTTNLNMVNHCGGDAETTTLICASVAYMELTGNSGACIQCPLDETRYGYTDKGTAITDCYLPAGATFSDTTGKYVYDDKCWYKN